MQAGGEGLLEAHEYGPRPELPPMGVSGELQVETRGRGGGRRTGLVRKQYAGAPHPPARRAARPVGRCGAPDRNGGR